MLYRLIIILFLVTSVYAGDIYKNWPPGRTEKLTYEIKTVRPRETTSYSYLDITRDTIDKEIFIVKQTIDIPGQKVKIVSEEKYKGSGFRLLSSENYFLFPPEAKDRMGADSLHVSAVLEGDTLDIKSSGSAAVSGKLYFPESSVSSAGSMLKSRNLDFTIGNYVDYKFVNLIQLTGQFYELADVRDSVVGETEVETPAGTFECYRVKNIVTGSVGYSYYDKNEYNIPVKTELVYERTGNPLMTLTLIKYEVQ